MSAKQQVVAEIFRPARRNFARRKVVLKSLNDLLQADLMDMSQVAHENDSNRFILTAINCFSKFGYCIPLKDKKASTVTTAMEKILNSSKALIKSEFRHIQTDEGKEFLNKELQALLKSRGIKHYTTHTELKASICERFNKTIKINLSKLMAIRASMRYIDFLPEVVDFYNNRRHRTIKMTPKAASRKSVEKKLLSTVYNYNRVRVKTKFKVGDFVRVSKAKYIFSRGFHPQFTPEVFEVTAVNNKHPPTYKIKAAYTGEEIVGTFYEPEMTRVKDKDVYLIERVVKVRGGKRLVKWLGFDESHNSWVDAKDFLENVE